MTIFIVIWAFDDSPFPLKSNHKKKKKLASANMSTNQGVVYKSSCLVNYYISIKNVLEESKIRETGLGENAN